MPLHKSTRAPRLDPTMISAPLGDFRHTMHIGRGGDAFGDTSFLSTLGPTAQSSDRAAPSPDDPLAGHDEAPGTPPASGELQHSESVSSFTLDLDLDLGPSMLGDVLGVMDGLGLEPDKGETPRPVSSGAAKQAERSTNVRAEVNGMEPAAAAEEEEEARDARTTDGPKPKGLRPKVRFSDKREEIIRQASEEDDGQGFDFQHEDQPGLRRPAAGGSYGDGEHAAPPSPAALQGSNEEVTALDRRRADNGHSETDSEDDDDDDDDDEEEGRGYTFEDEFDDEIGL